MKGKCSGRTESQWALIQDLDHPIKGQVSLPTSRLWFPAAGPILRAVAPSGAEKMDGGLGLCTKSS